MPPLAKPMASQRPSWLLATADGCAAELGTLLLGFGELSGACSKHVNVEFSLALSFATLHKAHWPNWVTM